MRHSVASISFPHSVHVHVAHLVELCLIPSKIEDIFLLPGMVCLKYWGLCMRYQFENPWRVMSYWSKQSYYIYMPGE